MRDSWRNYNLHSRSSSRGAVHFRMHSVYPYGITDGTNPPRCFSLRMGLGRDSILHFNLEKGTIHLHHGFRAAQARAVINRFFMLAELPYFLELSGAGWGRSATLSLVNTENDRRRPLEQGTLEFGLSGRQYRSLVDKLCVTEREISWAIGRGQSAF